MKDDQLIRGVGILAVVVIVVTRLLTIGNGPITLFGWEAAPTALGVVVVLFLALPETIDMLPVGPTRKK
jgi:hypothetical protein